jgi:hypothetical protein
MKTIIIKLTNGRTHTDFVGSPHWFKKIHAEEILQRTGVPVPRQARKAITALIAAVESTTSLEEVINVLRRNAGWASIQLKQELDMDNYTCDYEEEYEPYSEYVVQPVGY